jgi:hypothetical protein
MLYSSFEHPSVPIGQSYYFWNVTNVPEVTAIFVFVMELSVVSKLYHMVTGPDQCLHCRLWLAAIRM